MLRDLSSSLMDKLMVRYQRNVSGEEAIAFSKCIHLTSLSLEAHTSLI